MPLYETLEANPLDWGDKLLESLNKIYLIILQIFLTFWPSYCAKQSEKNGKESKLYQDDVLIISLKILTQIQYIVNKQLLDEVFVISRITAV